MTTETNQTQPPQCVVGGASAKHTTLYAPPGQRYACLRCANSPELEHARHQERRSQA